MIAAIRRYLQRRREWRNLRAIKRERYDVNPALERDLGVCDPRAWRLG